MRTLLILVDWYLPGFKAGGQIQSCAHLTNALKSDIKIFVLTSDRDLGDQVPYTGIKSNEWVDSPYGYKIQYISPENMRYKFIRDAIREVNADSIYLNSMFSVHFTIMALAATVYTPSIKAKIILAPRGMLHEGALQFKKLKKQFFIKIFRILNVQKRIVFHATDEREKNDIAKVFGKSVKITYVDDFPRMTQHPLAVCSKEKGKLNIVFISRISPKKNLKYVLDLLPSIDGIIDLTIIGPIEDQAYWLECQEKIESFSKNINVNYIGSVPNKDLHDFYSSAHLFVLPTFGENFGHVIFESLLNGRPVLISDQTPWNDLQQNGSGWSIPLLQTADFIAALEQAVKWDQDDFNRHCKSSWSYAENHINDSTLKDEYLQLFTN